MSQRETENIFQLRKRNFIVLNLIGNKVCLGGFSDTSSFPYISAPPRELCASSITYSFLFIYFRGNRELFTAAKRQRMGAFSKV